MGIMEKQTEATGIPRIIGFHITVIMGIMEKKMETTI